MLPYEYVIEAVTYTNKIRRERLHEYERPIAMLAVQQAEMHRDTKKRKKPFTIEEFCLYGEATLKDMPDLRYGAAAKALLERKLFPYWALFIYKDLVNLSDTTVPPLELALIGSDCIILAPN